MGHPQPRTPIQTDNTTAEGVINNKIQPKQTKAIDMRFHWLRDGEAQGQFRIYWRQGKTNLVDYIANHHPPSHHVNMQAESLTKVKDLAEGRRQRQLTGQTKPPSHLQASSYKGVLNIQSQELASELLAKEKY